MVVVGGCLVGGREGNEIIFFFLSCARARMEQAFKWPGLRHSDTDLRLSDTDFILGHFGFLLSCRWVFSIRSCDRKVFVRQTFYKRQGKGNLKKYHSMGVLNFWGWVGFDMGGNGQIGLTDIPDLVFPLAKDKISYKGILYEMSEWPI